jgi:branched-chain amino acid transport system ATP-binding protein
MSLLHVTGLAVAYGPVHALKGIDITVEDGEIVALLGANGAGKTTALRAISRTQAPVAGRIEFAGIDLTRRPPAEVVAAGLAHAPEGRRIFPDLTVAENLDLGAYVLRDRSRLAANLDRVFHYFPLLAERRRQPGGTLSGGEQQMLAIARALMSSPRLLMLDEPSLGLAPLFVDKVFTIIADLNRQERLTILLVEQNANEALLHAHRAYILETGTITIHGPADTLRHDPRVIAAYLGG